VAGQQQQVVAVVIMIALKANRAKAPVRAGEIGALGARNSPANRRNNGALVHV
jgi:hypothetical protein